MIEIRNFILSIIIISFINLIEANSFKNFDVKIYTDENFGGTVTEFPKIGCSVKSCVNLQKAKIISARSIRTEGCIKLYTRFNCGGQTLMISSSISDLATKDFKNRVRSFIPCNLNEKIASQRLNGTIQKIEFLQDFQKQLEQANLKPIEMAASITIPNNGSQILQTRLSRSKSVAKEVSVQKISGLTQLHQVNFAYSVKSSASVSIPAIASASIEQDISTGYNYARTTNTQDTTSESTREEETFTIEQTILTSPCEYSTVQFLLDTVDGMPMEFKLLMNMKGENCGEQMTATQLKEGLPSDFIYIQDINENEIAVSTKGKVVAKFGTKAYIKIDSRPIEYCYKHE